jgi:ComF family protein
MATSLAHALSFVLRGTARLLDEALAPGRCSLCDLPSGRSLDLCPVCEGDLPELGRPCRRCALPLPANAASELCGPCLRRPPPFETLTAACAYADPADLLVTGLKFRRERHAARVMATLMTARAGELVAQARARGAALVPVPLHPLRRWRRGHDQAALLAEQLAALTGLPLATGLVRRVRATAPQAGLGRRARQRNLAGAFRVRAAARGRPLVLVDDVATTGATLAAVARAARRAGAARVDAWVFARTERDGR